MSAKFKPKKREAEAVVEDWEASDDDGEQIVVPVMDAESTSASAAKAGSRATVQAAWEDDEREAGQQHTRPAPIEGKRLWEEANRAEPQAQPIIANRTLPTALLAPRLSASSAGLAGTPTDEYDSRPPPQILRRDRSAEAASANAAGQGEVRKKTMAEREEEYRKARERIFGTSNTTTSDGTGMPDGGGGGGKGKGSGAQSRNMSGSDTGGRNSPAGRRRKGG